MKRFVCIIAAVLILLCGCAKTDNGYIDLKGLDKATLYHEYGCIISTSMSQNNDGQRAEGNIVATVNGIGYMYAAKDTVLQFFPDMKTDIYFTGITTEVHKNYHGPTDELVSQDVYIAEICIPENSSYLDSILILKIENEYHMFVCNDYFYYN